MRPPGEVRADVLGLFREHAPCSWGHVAPLVPRVDQRSPSDLRLVRRTVENLVQAGSLERVGQEKPAGSRVWRALYAPVVTDEQGVDVQQAPSALDAQAAMDAIENATRGWAQFV